MTTQQMGTRNSLNRFIIYAQFDNESRVAEITLKSYILPYPFVVKQFL